MTADESHSLLPPPKMEREHSPFAICKSCGYNLRGIPVSHPCPECGAIHSDRQDYHHLRHSDPGWIRRVACGGVVLATGVGLFTVVAFLGTTDAVEIGNPIRTWGYPVCCFVEIVGLILLTAREPSRHTREPAISLRRLLRIVSQLIFMLELWRFIPSLAVPSLAFGWNLVVSIVALYALLLFIRVFLIGNHLRNLADRFPDTALATRILYATWGYCLGIVAMIPLGFIFPGSTFLFNAVVIAPAVLANLFRMILIYRIAWRLFESANVAESFAFHTGQGREPT